MLKVLLPGAALAGALFASTGFAAAERAVPLPAAKIDVPATTATQTAVFAGGCFWGMEAVFERVKGVKTVTAGYAGGTARPPPTTRFRPSAPAMPRRFA